MLRSRVLPIVLLTWNAIAAFSEECVAKLVHRVLLLYLVVSFALTIYILVAARVRRELQGSSDAAINFRLELWHPLFLTTIMVIHFPLLSFPVILDSACLQPNKMFIMIIIMCV